ASHDALLCIQTGKQLSDPDRFRFNGSGYYIKTADEMRAVDSSDLWAEGCRNTLLVAEKVDPTGFFEFKNLMPTYPIPEGMTEEQFFRTDPERFLRDAREMVVVTHPVFDAGGRTLGVIELSGADMEEVLDTPQRALGERSWRQAYRDDLVQAAEEMRVEPDVVLLTGG
ncbi:hypothetical protein, partial [Nocardioides vastitatis]